MFGRQVLVEDQCRTRMGGPKLEQLFEGLQSAGQRAHADDGEVELRPARGVIFGNRRLAGFLVTVGLIFAGRAAGMFADIIRG